MGKNNHHFKEYEALLRDKYPVLKADDLVKLFPFTKAQIKNAASRLKLRKLGRLDSWNYADECRLIELYANMSNRELGEMFGKSESAVSGAGFKLRLFKSEEFHKIRSAKGHFPKGHIPLNAGKKQVDYMSPEQIAKTAATRFKKGQINHNSLYDGCIRVRHDHPERGGKPHKYIRISKGVWKELQHYNWEQINGPIPKGHILACLDGDTLNCNPSNWELITMGENARRNSGQIHLTDKYVAGLITRQGNGRSKVDEEIRDTILQYPELVELKRKQIILQRTIKQHGKAK